MGRRFFAEGIPACTFEFIGAQTSPTGVLLNHYKVVGPSKRPNYRSSSMRFMRMVIPKGYESSATDAVPTAEAVAKTIEYNKALQKAECCSFWMACAVAIAICAMVQRRV
jgi:hypothetical protein